MADPRRWDASSRRDDQFVRPPAFRDAHESNHLTAGNASWHGSGSRQVALAAVLAIAAGVAAIAFMLLVAPSGGGIAQQGPLGAAADDPARDDPADAIDVGDIQVPASSAGNATTSLPLPGLPAP